MTTIYDVKEVGWGWSEIVIDIDDEGNPIGGFLIPTRYVLQLIKVADRVMPKAKEKLGL